jgi:hypothetical protein
MNAGGEKEAVDFVLPSRLPMEMRRTLHAGQLDECEEIYNGEIQNILSECENEGLEDRKDFLYLHGRVARFIFSLGYYKELAVELRRPFLAGNVLDVVRHMPAKFRVNKNAYVSMLKRRFPRAMRVPGPTVSSLPDWEYDLRTKPEIRGFFLEYLSLERIGSGVLRELLEPRAFAKVRDDFFQAEVQAMPSSRSGRIRRIKKEVSSFAHRSRALDRWYKAIRKENRKPFRSTFDFLRCVALITLLEEQLDRLGGGEPMGGRGRIS